MDIVHRWLFFAIWFGWAAYWSIRAVGAKATARHEPVGSRLAHILPLAAAFWLLAVLRPWPLPMSWTVSPFDVGLTLFWTGAAIAAAGLGITVWARVHLGRNWSGTVTVKHDHELVRSGPYAWVRHPIYTGLLCMFAGSALARADVRGVLAFVICWLALWRKLRLEERWMGEVFGTGYADYRQRVPALLPTRAPWRASQAT